MILFLFLQALVGVYWGAFDPPTEAHFAIIEAAKERFPTLLVVVNNNCYKKYTYSLAKRIQWLKEGDEHLEILTQDDEHPIDLETLHSLGYPSLCAIAGYDAYLSWIFHSLPKERTGYDAIAVVPRGGLEPILFDANAFLLPIDPSLAYLSSTLVKSGSPVSQP